MNQRTNTSERWYVGLRYGDREDRLPIEDENGGLVAVVECADTSSARASRAATDAALIAAAPKLLAVAKVIDGWGRNSDGTPRTLPPKEKVFLWREFMLLARSAVAEAEGRAQ